MLEKLKEKAIVTKTENGAIAYSSSMDECLDLFSAIGGMRHSEENDIIKHFVRAYVSEPDIAMKILFYTRDIRKGLGERRIFRSILRYLANNFPQSVIKNIDKIAEFGRFDDLLVLIDTPCQDAMISLIRKQLREDQEALAIGNNVSLLGKWLPSVNATNANTVKLGKQIAGLLGFSDKEYRQLLSKLRRQISIIENYLREQDYSFDYETQPSKALFKYRAAFGRNDDIRFSKFLDDVTEGKVELNSNNLYPYEIIRPIMGRCKVSGKVSDEERKVLDTTWNSMPEFSNNSNALAVIDGSGSMYTYVEPIPATVALSLGLYFAERAKGTFANHFITFSERPQLIELKGQDLYEKIKYISTFDEVANTNIQAVFDLILDTAIDNKICQEDMPEALYIISDMEFDQCAENANISNFEYAKKAFEEKGYRLPKVIFWNVASRELKVPVKKNEQGVALVSGCTPRLFSNVLNDNLSPYQFMLNIIEDERYAGIVA